MEFYILLVSFFFIALVYSSVGFGGGTSYLALMGVMAVSFEVMRPAALICNIVVVTGGVFIFYKEKLIELKKIWPFIVASVPLAFLGGYYPIKENTFFRILGVTLVVAAISLWFFERMSRQEVPSGKSDKLILNLLLGGSIGFLSGLVSIGGGIFLSPILHFLRWDHARKISALASIFILVNSVSGLVGQVSQTASIDWRFIFPLLAAVLLGGQVGSRLGAIKFNPLYIRRITAALILVAGINILINH
ncbi:MAG TPA: sulfite exporter TauE/SafE family protein [Cyclobacteriaceae bacterium]|nr:sulfite exporter TauE/SafE family protein [Cyclobacteriaceae bacterium]